MVSFTFIDDYAPINNPTSGVSSAITGRRFKLQIITTKAKSLSIVAIHK